MRRCIPILSFFLLALAVNTNAQNLEKNTYKNQRGSILTLKWHPTEGDTGYLTGHFTTTVGDCPEDMNVSQPIKGYYNQNTLTLSINFPHCKQVLAMTGNIDENKSKISMLWVDAHVTSDPDHKDWNTNLIGTDKYRKTNN